MAPSASLGGDPFTTGKGRKGCASPRGTALAPFRRFLSPLSRSPTDACWLVFIRRSAAATYEYHYRMFYGIAVPDGVTNRSWLPPSRKRFAKFPRDDINANDTPCRAYTPSPLCLPPTPSRARQRDFSKRRTNIGGGRISVVVLESS